MVSVADDFQGQLIRAVHDAVAKKLNATIPLAIPGIRRRIGSAMEEAVLASTEYSSLIGGRLQAELGVVDPGPIVISIARAIEDEIQILFRPAVPSGTSIGGGLTISILRSDLAEALGVSGASFQSEGGYQIDWLKWLLTEGDKLIITDHRFISKNTKASRTGLGIMKANGGWGVPAEFAGTYRDNWLTRALASIEAELPALIIAEIQKVF